jgi:hypothetical protein
VNVLFGGLPNRRAQNATRREVLNIERAVQTPLRWSEVPITLSCADQWTSFSEPWRFPLVLKPVIAGSRLNKVLIDGRSGLDVLFTKTLKKMKFDITHMLTKSTSPFYGIVPRNTAIPLGSVVLPVTFGETRENYRTEYIKFEVADFETSYHAILSRPAIAKFMAVPHYTYLVLKMPSPAGVLSLQGDMKISFDCDTEVVVRDNNVAADVLSKLGSTHAQVPAGVFAHELHAPSIPELVLTTTDPTRLPAGQEVMMIDVDRRQPFIDYIASRRFQQTRTWPSNSSVAPSPTS